MILDIVNCIKVHYKFKSTDYVIDSPLNQTGTAWQPTRARARTTTLAAILGSTVLSVPQDAWKLSLVIVDACESFLRAYIQETSFPHFKLSGSLQNIQSH